MERVHKNGKWTLMCPNECRGLSDVYGEEFDKLYIKYEKELERYIFDHKFEKANTRDKVSS